MIASSETPAVVVTAAFDLIAAGAVLVDVREDDEWAAGHAPQARHIPLDTLPSMPLGPEYEGRVIVICRSGRRSDAATMHLRGRGIDAYNLIGGMQAWQQAGGPVISDDETPGRVI
jgi:rhodanese-related sulfurtransferase